MKTFAVIDFETSGLSPAYGARPIEVAAVLVRDGKIQCRYQSLINAGVHIPYVIEELTGISNEMVSGAPAVKQVMGEVADFVGRYPLVAHNAAFDKKFWDAELKRLRIRRSQEFICSLMLARRIYPAVRSHALSALAQSLDLPGAGRYHRALADAQVTAHLFLKIKKELQVRYQLREISEELLLDIQRTPRSKLESCIEAYG